MIIYLVRRLAWGLLVLLGVSIITFLTTFAVPADPARNIGGIHATRAALENIRHAYGLDQPLPLQYWRYLQHLLRGDLGRAYSLSEDVLPAVLDRLPYTGILALCGILFELAIGVPLGVVAGVRPGGVMDRTGLLLTLLVFSLPPFVLGNLLLLLLAFHWTVFPLGGADEARSIVLPALTLGLGGAVWYSRLLRATLLDVLRSDYIRTARAKGLSRRRTVLVHALPNALGPIITQIGLDMSYFLGGVVVVESVFAWPGVGKLAYDAISHDDVNLIMGTVLVSAVFVVLSNILVDLVHVWLDPRIRLG
ncbi:MAG: ABC transporter permease [Chloroflexi bacterium]|nr:ABC transporter permease [Chloroflexota bacterium]